MSSVAKPDGETLEEILFKMNVQCLIAKLHRLIFNYAMYDENYWRNDTIYRGRGLSFHIIPFSSLFKAINFIIRQRGRVERKLYNNKCIYLQI